MGHPPKIIKRLECKCLLKRIGNSPEVAQTIVYTHGYNTAKKLSHLKPDDVDIIIKTLCTSGGECADRTRDPGSSILNLAHCALILVCFILFHHIQCNLCPTINCIDEMNVHGMDLQRTWENNHNNDLHHKNRPNWKILQTPSSPSQTIGSILSAFMEQTRPLVPICSIPTLSPSSTRIEQ